MSFLKSKFKVFLICIISLLMVVIAGVVVSVNQNDEQQEFLLSSSNICDTSASLTSSYSGKNSLYASMPEGVADWTEIFNFTLKTNDDDTQYYVVDGLKEEYQEITEFEIPAVYTDGIAITEIKNSAFSYNSNILSVTIPNSIVTIGSDAFNQCSSLANVIFEENSVCETIGSGAFRDCNAITEIIIPDSVVTIGTYAFDSDGLTSVTIPENVMYLGGAAVVGNNITEINFNAINVVDNDSQNSCFVSSKEFVLNIGPKVTRIPAYFCNFQQTLTKVNWVGNSSCKEIGDMAFVYCLNLQEITIPESIERIGLIPFAYCLNLSEINFNAINCADTYSLEGLMSGEYEDVHGTFTLAGIYSEGVVFNVGPEVTRIPVALFYSDLYMSGDVDMEALPKVTQINFPEDSKCTYIGFAAFAYCIYLTEITIPESITQIDMGAFMYCASLSTLNFNAINCADFSDIQDFSDIEKLEETQDEESMMRATVTPFIMAGILGEGVVINVGPKVTRIPSFMFFSLEYLYGSVEMEMLPKVVAVNFSENSVITTIGTAAFAANIYLSEATIPETVTNIGFGAYALCLSLNTINYNAISCNKMQFEKAAFIESGTMTIENGQEFVLNIGPKVENIPSYMFAATAITKVVFAESSICSTIGEYAFYQSYGLDSISMPNSIRSIGSYAFSEAVISSVELNEGLIVIGACAFNYCENLTEVTIPSTVLSLDRQVFYLNTAGLKVTMAGSVSGGTKAQVIQLITSDCFNQAIVYVPYGDISLYYASDYYTNTNTVAQLLATSFVLSIYCNVPGIENQEVTIDVNLDPIVFADVLVGLTRENYEFDGWYTHSTMLDEFIIYGTEGIYWDISIYARWKYIGDWSHMYTYETRENGDVYITGFDADMSLGVIDFTIPKDNLASEYVKGIASYAFGAGLMRSVDFEASNTITYIEPYAFVNNLNLSRIDFSQLTRLEVISEGAFKGCNLHGDLVLPINLQEIGESAFETCEISSYTIDNIYLTSESGIVYTSDKSTLVLAPYRVGREVALDLATKTIKKSAFLDTQGIYMIKGEGVTVVEDNAFARSSLEYFEFPNLITIGKNAFNGANLSAVMLAKTVTQIGDSAFVNNKALTNIMIEGRLGVSRESIPVITSVLASDETQIIVYVDKNDIETYKRTSWARFVIIGVDAGDIWEVTIDLEGGSGYSAIYHIINGSTIDLSITPTKVGYVFVTWKQVVDGELVPFSDTTPITGHTTIKAIWKAIIYEIVYTLNGGQIDNNVGTYTQNFTIAEFGEDLLGEIALQIPYKDGYEFIGWYSKEDFDSAKVRVIKYDMLTYNQVLAIEDVMLYAKWEVTRFTMKFDNSSAYTIALDGDTLNPVPYNDNFGFVIVFSEEYSQNRVENIVVKLYSEDGETYISTLDASSVELTELHYLIENVKNAYTIKIEGVVLNTYNVYFVSSMQGVENLPETISVTHGSSIEYVLSVPTKDGYEFKSWHRRIQADGAETIDANIFDFDAPIYSDITLVAQFEKQQYTILLYLNGAKVNNNQVESFTIKYSCDDTISLPLAGDTEYNISRPGYTIVGWYSDFEIGEQGEFIINEDSLVVAIEEGSYGDKVFVLGFSVNTYYITYYFNGGAYEEEYQTEFTVNDSFDLIVPERKGHTFAGWYTDSEMENIKVDKLDLGTYQDLKLYAKWEESLYNINYHLNGTNFTEVYIQGVIVSYSTNVFVKKYTYNETKAFVLDNTIRRKGYEFAGWYNNPEFLGDKIISMPAGSIVSDKDFYAKWTPIVYTITLDYTDLYTPTESDITSFTITSLEIENAGGSINITVSPEVEGFAFVGWFHDDTQVDAITTENMSHMTLEARYHVNQCNIYLVGENVAGNISLINNNVSITAVEYNNDLVFEIRILNPMYSQSISNLVVSYSYEEDGDYTTLTKQLNTYTISKVKDDIFIKIDNLTLNLFVIEFDSNGGTEVSAITDIEYGSTVIEPETPKKPGYAFAGWFTSNTFDTEFDFSTSITSSILLIAKWEKGAYTIILSNNINDETKEINYNIDNQNSISLAELNFDFVGYEFKGFYLIPEDYVGNYQYNSQDIVENIAGIYRSGEIIARFDIINYTIYYGIDNGLNNESNPNEYNINSEDIVLLPATKANYKFLAWVDANNGNEIKVISKGTIGNIYLLATFEIVSDEYVAVKYYANGEFYSEVAVKIGDSIENTPTAQVPIKDIVGYEFKGYYEDQEYTIPFSMSTIIEANTNIYGKYEKERYVITYLSNVDTFDNPTTNKTSVNIDDDFTLEDASKPGYDFKGWYTNVIVNNGQYDYSSAEKITRIINQVANLTLYAKFEVINYSITYDLSGGELQDFIDTYNINSDSIILDTPNKSGYKFINWTKLGTDEEVTVIEKGSIGNLSLVANFELITYKIIYQDSKSTTDGNPTEFTIETPAIMLIHNDVPGYTFMGWYDEKGNNIKVVGGGTTVNYKLTARYTITRYLITYVLDGGTLQQANPSSYTIETEITHLNPPSKLGYTFLHWIDSSTGNQIDSIPVGTTGDLIIIAEYRQVENYNVLIYYIDGIKYLFDSVESGGTINDIVPPSKTYYDFEGWYSDANHTNKITSSTIITTDMSLYAKFVPINYIITYDYIDDKGNVLTNIINTNDTVFNVEKLIHFVSPSKPGYTFEKFVCNNQNIVNTFGIYENVQITAIFKLTQYTISYILDDGVLTTANPSYYTIEDNSFVLSEPTREGYEFLGWYDNETGEKITSVNTSALKNYTIVARWQDVSIETEKSNNLIIVVLTAGLLSVMVAAFIIASKKIKKAKQEALAVPEIIEQESAPIVEPSKQEDTRSKYQKMLARKTIGVGKKKKTPKKQKGIFVSARDSDFYSSKMSKEIEKFKSDDD